MADATSQSDLNPANPCDAQHVLLEYLRRLQLSVEQSGVTCVRPLPYPSDMIQAAFCTSARTLVATHQMTEHRRVYLEWAYLSLADTTADFEPEQLRKEFSRWCGETDRSRS